MEGQPIPGSADGEIGLRQWLESEGHELVTTTDREGGEIVSGTYKAIYEASES